MGGEKRIAPGGAEKVCEGEAEVVVAGEDEDVVIDVLGGDPLRQSAEGAELVVVFAGVFDDEGDGTVERAYPLMERVGEGGVGAHRDGDICRDFFHEMRQHRLPREREERLGPALGEGPEARGEAAGEEEGVHGEEFCQRLLSCAEVLRKVDGFWLIGLS